MFRHLIGSGMAGVLMAAGLWREDAQRMLAVWLALIFAVIAARIWLTRLSRGSHRR